MATNTADALFQQAVRMHNQARAPQQYRAAVALYETVLMQKPGHPLVLHHLGECKLELNAAADALARFEAATRGAPDFAEAHVGRGRALSALGRHDEALLAFDMALKLNPDLVNAWFGHGNALLAMGRALDAIASFDTALTRMPEFAAAWLNRANALLVARRPDEALESAQRALTAEPRLIIAHLTIGRVLTELGRADEAIGHFDLLLAKGPLRDARVGRAQALAGAGRPEEALAELDALLAATPNDADAINTQGVILESMDRIEEALARYEMATTGAPAFVTAWVNRGRLARRLDRRPEAADALARAMRLDAGNLEAMLELAELARLENLPDVAEGWLMRARGVALAEPELLVGDRLAAAHASQCRWRDNALHEAVIREQILAGNGEVKPLAVLAWLDDPELALRAARNWVARHFPDVAAPVAAARAPGRIRVAYLSADFHNHATMILAARLFELHDRERFEVWGVSIGPEANDAMRQRARAAFEHFVDAREMSDAEVIAYLRERGIDIAVDLKGYTKDARTGILAGRCAPIQINYLGYPGSMGADFIDYVIADETVIPVDGLVHFQERVVWLPDSYQVNDATREIHEDAPSRAELGLPENGFVFCCFNGVHKIKPAVFDLWMRLLTKVEGSVLWLLCDDETAQANLRGEAEKRGVAPDRLVFARIRPIAKHLARLARADLFLDTLPYGAHTTASDALWAGVPVLTRPGRAFAGRVAASLLKAVGLPELIAGTPDEYEAIALRLAGNPDMLADLRARLTAARATAPLFDSDRFRRHLEAAFQHMHARRLAGQAPADFAVLADGGVADITGRG